MSGPTGFDPRSRTGSDHGPEPGAFRRRVSIHAPARGATTDQAGTLEGREFRSTLPHGERLPAIASFLSPDAAERQEAATTKRLDQVDRRMTRMERDLGISVEMLAVFVRFWLTTNPPLPEPAQAAARAQGGERYDAFVAALGRRLAKGPKLRQEISEDVSGVADAQ